MTANTLPSATTIGLFDSGVGGLSVLRQLERNLSNARLIYVGDTARCPYGGRDAAEISAFVVEIISWLINRGAEQIVMACNTSAALAAEVARSNFNLPIYDLIGSGAQHAVSLSNKVAVLATENTVRTRVFTKAIEQIDPTAEVFEIACPDLVPLVERGRINEPETRDALWKHTRHLSAQGVGAVILGCTHYPFLHDALKAVLPDEIAIIDPAERLYLQMFASSTKGNGNGHGDGNGNGNGHGNGNGSGDYKPAGSKCSEIYVTGSTETFARSSEICLGRKLDTISGITVEDLTSAVTASFAATSSREWAPVPPVVPAEAAQLGG